MAETISAIILLFFTLMGVVYCIKTLILLILKPPQESKMTLVLPLSGHHEDIEYLIRCAVEHRNWYAGRNRLEILLIDCGMDNETINLCNEICKRFDHIKIEKLEGLERSFTNGLQNKEGAL